MGLLRKAEGKRSFISESGQTLRNSFTSKAALPDALPELEGFLEQYFKSNSSAEGIIVNVIKDGLKKISAMVSHFAVVEELPSGRSLILFSNSYDRDLIAHRLKKNLDAEIPLLFSAGNPAEAIYKIRLYR